MTEGEVAAKEAATGGELVEAISVEEEEEQEEAEEGANVRMEEVGEELVLGAEDEGQALTWGLTLARTPSPSLPP